VVIIGSELIHCAYLKQKDFIFYDLFPVFGGIASLSLLQAIVVGVILLKEEF
jgi:hypothetical protein